MQIDQQLVLFPPKSDNILGGTIQVIGTAIDDDSVDYVLVRVDYDGDGLFTSKRDLYDLDANGDFILTDDGVDYKEPFEDETKWVKVAVNNGSWNLELNEYSQFTKTNLEAHSTNGGTNGITNFGTINIEAKAIDINSLEGLSKSVSNIQIDENYPVIVDFIIEGDDDETVGSEFSVIGHATDNDGFNAISLTFAGGIKDTLDKGLGYPDDDDMESGKYYINDLGSDGEEVKFKYTQSTLNKYPEGTSGLTKIILSVEDNASPKNESSAILNIGVDNVEPSGVYTGNIANLGSNNTIISGTANDSGYVSGINKILVYFVERGTDGSVLAKNIANGATTDIVNNLPDDLSYVLTIDNYDDLSGNDGDSVRNEIFKYSNGSYIWSGTIDTSKVTGCEIHYLVYDNAGNYTHYNEAAVTVGTDRNGQGGITADEKGTYFVSYFARNLFYIKPAISVTNSITTISYSTNGGQSFTNATVVADTIDISNFTDGNYIFRVIVKDSDSNEIFSKDMNVTIVGSDTAPPKISYVNEITYESVVDYNKTSPQGHFDTISNKNKLSGKVLLKGTATDDLLLNDIKVTISHYNGSSYDKIFDDITIAKWVGSSFTGVDGGNGLLGKTDPVESTFNFDDENARHKVNFELEWDTSYISDLVGRVYALEDIKIEFKAVDSQDKSSEYKTVPGGDFDIVPYITTIETNLSNLKSNNPSVYNRTALGKYPVNSTETIKIHGFNLQNADVQGTTKEASSGGIISLPVADLSSGKLSLSVNGVSFINNINSNSSEYNKKPNNDNNLLLTDDVDLDIWEFDSEAAKPISGMIEQPIMKINPDTGIVGFAFVNGPLYFSMGDSTYSSNYWMGSYDFFTSVGFSYDSQGYSYGVAAGGDINSSSADKFQLMSSRWGVSSLGQSGSYINTNSLRLESIGQKDSNGTRIFNKQRIKSPSMATAVHGTDTNLYLAYYDDMNEEIRFKYGKATKTSKENFGSFRDYDTEGDAYYYRNAYVSMIAGSNTGNYAGEYVSIAVVSEENTTDDDVVVAIWYDATNRYLWYTYNTTPTTNRNGETDGSGWSIPKRVFNASSGMANAGEYCQIVTDKSGGIHIAAYDPNNLDLVYAYLDSYTDSTFETCVVDGFGVVGTNITLDVALTGTEWIPYIGYYATSSIKPKYAYKVSLDNAPNGSVNEEYTGNWELTILPTNKTLTMGSLGNNKINVGVWKDADWMLIDSVTGTKDSYHNGSSYYASCWDKVYGNGTKNPILGYAIKDGTSGYIETAQKK